MDNLYQHLGVTETATQDEIKSQFRKLAKKHHPDANPGNKEAEDKFKQISAAYEILSSPEKRARYDQEQKYGQSGFAGFNSGFSPFGPGGGVDMDSIFNHIFTQSGFRPAAPSKNRDFNFSLTISLEDAFNGQTVPIHFTNPATKSDIALDVKIPAGVESGTRIRFAGYGDNSVSNIQPGDLYVIIQISEQPVFKRNGPHLVSELTLSAIDCMLGYEHPITCLDGSQITVKIPAGSQNGSMFRVRGKGMPIMNGNHGDLILALVVTIPKLNHEQSELCRQLKEKINQ